MIIKLPGKDRFTVREVSQIVDKHVSTIFRWALRGIRGHRLRLVLIGGQRYVLRQDLLAFFHAINEESATPSTACTATRRQQQIDQAAAELAEAGF